MLKTGIREARVEDIARLQIIRHAVKENVLSNPDLVTDQDCEDYLTRRGKGWVYEQEGEVQGFAIVDLPGAGIWALFIHPDYERKGIGRLLHDTMLDWFFRQGKDLVWLSTAPNTRAEAFYRKAGWTVVGELASGELKFEMSRQDWWDKIDLAEVGKR